MANETDTRTIAFATETDTIIIAFADWQMKPIPQSLHLQNEWQMKRIPEPLHLQNGN